MESPFASCLAGAPGGDYLSRAIVDCSGAHTADTAFMGHLLPMDHDRQDVSTPATRCAAGIMPVAVSLSNAPPTATPSSLMGQKTTPQRADGREQPVQAGQRALHQRAGSQAAGQLGDRQCAACRRPSWRSDWPVLRQPQTQAVLQGKLRRGHRGPAVADERRAGRSDPGWRAIPGTPEGNTPP